jgi:hypothetical protein
MSIAIVCTLGVLVVVLILCISYWIGDILKLRSKKSENADREFNREKVHIDFERAKVIDLQNFELKKLELEIKRLEIEKAKEITKMTIPVMESRITAKTDECELLRKEIDRLFAMVSQSLGTKDTTVVDVKKK